MNAKAFFLFWGGSILILGIGRKNQIFLLRTPAAVKFFSQNCQKMTFWCKKKSLPMRFICITHMGSSTLFARGIIIFQGILTKFYFLTKFPVLEKFAYLMKDLKYEHQSIFPFSGRVYLNFRDR